MAYKYQKYFNAALALVEEAGQLIKSRIWAPKAVSTKTSATDFVTETDQEIEDLLINGLRCQFSDENFKFIGEETSAKDDNPILFTEEPTWIIDPVDGTMNFVHGNPHVAVSLGFYKNREPEFGIIYMPMFDQMFTGIKGFGAKLNQRQIKVSNVKDVGSALICMQCHYNVWKGNEKVWLDSFESLIPKVHGIRSYGTAAYGLVTVAMGATDAYIEIGPHIWDIAGALPIITEAGGTVLDPSGGPLDLMSRRVLATSTPELAKSFFDVMDNFHPPRDD